MTPIIKNIINFRKLVCYAFFSLFLIYGQTAFAGIYKWVDAEGNTHYGERPPGNASSEKMNVQRHAPRDTSSYARPGAKNADASTDGDDKDKDTKEEQAEAKPEKTPETKAEKNRRLAACSTARANRTRMESIGRIRGPDKDGNLVYLSQPQKEAKMKKLNGLITKHCK